MNIEYIFNPDGTYYIFFTINKYNCIYKSSDNTLSNNLYVSDRKLALEYLKTIGLKVKKVIV